MNNEDADSDSMITTFNTAATETASEISEQIIMLKFSTNPDTWLTKKKKEIIPLEYASEWHNIVDNSV